MMKRISLLFCFSFFAARLFAQTPALTDSAAVRLGRTIEEETDDQRFQQLSNILDLNSFVQRMTEACPPLKDPAFRRGFLETFSPNFSKLGASLSNAAIGGSYRLLREYDSNGVKHLLFRAFGKVGLNYHDYALMRVRDSIKAFDIYLYTSGEFISRTMADLVAGMDAGHDLEKASDEVVAIKKIRDYYKQHSYSEAKAVYDGMPATLQNSKAVQMVYISVSQHLGDSMYEAALNHFQRIFPDAPNTYLMMIDLYYLRKNYQKGMEVVDKLDGIVRDPILNLYRGNIVKASGQQEEAIGYYQKAYQYDPGFTMNTRTLIVTFAQLGRLDDAKKVIAEFKQQKSFHAEDISEIYTAFPSLKD